MTRINHHRLHPSVLLRFGRLVQIHLLTHPDRVAQRHGVSPEYVYRQFRNMVAPDMRALAHRLDEWVRGYRQYRHGGRGSLEALALELDQWLADCEGNTSRKPAVQTASRNGKAHISAAQ